MIFLSKIKKIKCGYRQHQNLSSSVRKRKEEVDSLLRFDGKFIFSLWHQPWETRQDLIWTRKQCRWFQTNSRFRWDNMASVCYVITLVVFSTAFAYATHHQDRFCVRNFGCDTDFQDMALGVTSARQCQSLCDANDECQYFTWWSDGIFKHICMHHASCTRLDFKCQHCHAGPRSSGCPLRRRRRHRRPS